MSYELAFETIGNATLIAHDRVPVLATDPWLDGAAYFGSWTLTHQIPAEQRDAIARCPYIWISHGHPDHLSFSCLERLRGKTILLADHVGGRIRDALVDAGHVVQVLPDRSWHALSPNVHVMTIADPNQDAILFVRIGSTLIVNANDASERGWGRTVRHHAAQAERTLLLALSGYGDADMINYFDTDGARITPYAGRKLPPGPAIARRLARLGCQDFIPFASMHCYQREDSAWANEFTTPLEDHALGFPDTTDRRILPAFVRYDCTTGDVHELQPPEAPLEIHSARDFGDDWSDELDRDDRQLLDSYFRAITSLEHTVDAVVFSVGGREHAVRTGHGSGCVAHFAVPRASLVTAAKWEIFDDLLIGNFMKTTLEGPWPNGSLNPAFTAPVTKYADNGRAKTPAEVRGYLGAYRRRAPRDFAEERVSRAVEGATVRTARFVRARTAEGSMPHRVGRRLYRAARR